MSFELYYNQFKLSQGFPNFLGERPQMDIMKFLQPQAYTTLHFLNSIFKI